MNNYCKNCGEKLGEKINECPRCKTKVNESQINIEQEKKVPEEYHKKDIIYFVATLILYLLPLLMHELGEIFEIFIFDYIGPFFTLASVITIISARIKMPESKKIKILFIIIIALSIVELIGEIIKLIICDSLMNIGCM